MKIKIEKETVFQKAWNSVKGFFYDIKVLLSPKKKVTESTSSDYLSKQKRSRKVKETLCIWSVLIIPLIDLAIFWVYGTIKSIPIAFEQYDVSTGAKTYGLFNFKYVLDSFSEHGSIFPEAFFNSMKYWLFSFLVLLPLSYLMAYFLYKKIPGYKGFRYIFFFPHIISSVIFAALFKYIVGPNGFMPNVIEFLTHKPDVLLLRDSSTAFKTMLFYNFYMGMTGNMIYNLAAFARIPQEVTESAVLDGVNIWQEIRYMVFPLTFPFFGTMMVLSLTGLFTTNGAALLLTGGGYGTYDLGFYNYVLTTSGSKASQGISGAIGLITGTLTLPIALVVNKLVQKIEPIEY